MVLYFTIEIRIFRTTPFFFIHPVVFSIKTAQHPGDLDTRKSTGTSCQIEIHFMIKTTEYLL